MTTMALFSSSPTIPTLFSTSSKPQPHPNYPFTHHKPYLHLKTPQKPHFCIKVSSSSENGTTSPTIDAAVQPTKVVDDVGPIEAVESSSNVNKFKDVRWVNGTWDLQQFQFNGSTHWDSLIDAEAKRRKWLETYPESTTNDEPVVFDTSIIPWWAWIKRFHLPEAELLNGRAAMIGFFMSYFVDSLTGVGLVDQMSNFFCKTLLFVAVLGVLFIRKNEDVENLKKLLDESTFYDKQWQATWQEDSKEN